MTDIVANASTTAFFEGFSAFGTIGVKAYSGEFESSSDVDWIRIDVVAGQTYQFLADADYTASAAEPFDLNLRNASGVVLQAGQGLFWGASYLSYTAQSSESLYISIGYTPNYPHGIYDVLAVAGPARQLQQIGIQDPLTSGSLIAGRYLDDLQTGLPANTIAFGASGADTFGTEATGAIFLHGGTGDDSLIGNLADDWLWGGWGNDELTGGDGNDHLIGNQGDDFVLGGVGKDTLMGGDGYDLLAGNEGADALYGGADGDILVGGDDADTLDGGSGADQMIGGTGADNMTGGLGNDIYVVDNAGDSVIEKNETGVDTVNSAVTFALTGQYVENLILNGAAAINGTGNSLANTLDGSQNGAANTLIGGTGNDTYIVGANDKVVEASGSAAGTLDIVKFIGTAGQTFSLAGQYIERLELTGSAATNGTGNSLANTIVGNDASNIIAGGSGKDSLTGGGGKDFFLFNTALNASTNVDIVHGYSVADDTFQLARTIFTGFNGYGQATVGRFWSNTTGLAHDADDRIIYETDSGKLFYDADGTGATAGVHFATVATGLALTNADFDIVAMGW